MKQWESGIMTFQGVTFNYTLKNPEVYRNAVFQHCNRSAFKVPEGKVWGIELLHAAECLRKYAQLKLPELTQDLELMFRALGFHVSWGTNNKSQHVTIIHT